MNRADAGTGWTVTTTDGFRWRRSEDGIDAEWVGVLTLRIDLAGRVTHEAAAGADARVVSKVLSTGAAAFVRALDAQPSLHASAITRAGATLICLGDKGAGKSTAASELCKHHGFELLADDVAALDDSTGRWQVLPTESATWLADGADARKGPVAAPRVARDAAEPTAVAVLRFDEAAVGRVRATRLRGAAAYSALTSAFLRFEAADAMRVRELDVLSALAAQVPVYEVMRARAARPPETAGALLHLMDPAR
jgi:hypothetical protein